MTQPLFRIGARGSPLSMVQAKRVRWRLAQRLGRDESQIDLAFITTSGDRIQDQRLLDFGGKGLFTKELDEALLQGRIDLAVHSLKDLPTRLPDGVDLACVPEREDPRDAFVSLHWSSLAALPAGANVGTASLRRQAQTLYARPDLGVVTLRGNVDTRLKKLEAGEADATFLAYAGLKRLGLAERATALVDPNEAPPAACQGAIAITTRADDKTTSGELAPLEDHAARIEVEAERAFLAALDGSCRTPIGALARANGASLSFVGETLTPDGTARWRRVETIMLGGDPLTEARALGRRLGDDIRREAGDAIVMDKA